MRLIAILAAPFLLLVLTFMPTTAVAQYAQDYPRPAVVDPAWFAGVKTIETTQPAQSINTRGDEYVSKKNLPRMLRQTWNFYTADEFVQAKLVPLDKGWLRKLEAASKKYPQEQNWREYIALAYLRAGRFDLFFPEINAQLEKWYSSSSALTMRAETLAMLGRDDLALADLKSALHWAMERKKNSHTEIGYILAAKAEVLARMGRKREASFDLSDANVNIEPDNSYPGHKVRIKMANRAVTRLLHGWSDAELARIDAELDRPRGLDCNAVPQEVATAKEALYRLFDTMWLLSWAHDYCNRWAEAEISATWMTEMGLRPETPMTASEKWEYWYRGTDILANAMIQQGKYKEAQGQLVNVLLVDAPENWLQKAEEKMASSIVAGRANGIEPASYVLTAYENSKTNRANKEIADANQAIIDARNKELDDYRANIRVVVVTGTEGPATAYDDLDSYMRTCQSLQKDMSPDHPEYYNLRALQAQCDGGRLDGVRKAIARGDHEKRSYYENMRFSWD